MKQIILLFFSILSLSVTAQNIRAYLAYNDFYSPKDGPYIETYVQIEGSSVEWKKNSNHKYQAQVEFTLIFEKDSNIVDFSKIIIKSPEVSDSSEMNLIFMNTQRFALANGKYDLKIKIDDLNDTIKADYILSDVDIEMPENKASISSIMAVKQFSESNKEGVNNHSGYDLVPNIYNYFPEQDSIFTFYAELYNLDKSIGADEPYVINYYISNFETSAILPKYKRFKRRKAKAVDVIFNQLNINNLPTGNFVFTIELIDKEMKLINKKEYFFQRENKNVNLEENDIKSINIINTFAELITGKDTLKDILQSMNPISSDPERVFVQTLIKNGDIRMMQQYLYNFWFQRNPNEPSKPFIAYMTEVMRVNKDFSTSIKRGYQTDRGIVYLKYGQPNSIVKQYHEPSTYPYEIWHYYGIRGQGNVKFVFYNTDLATNNFDLLHSNAIGEVSNYRWRLILRKRDKGYKSIDDTGQETDEWGTHYNEYYEQPR